MYFSSPYSPRKYYVDSANGDDANNGNYNAPIKSLAAVSNLLLLPGDKLLFRRGETWINETLTIAHSGITDLPITISAYGDAKDAPVFFGGELLSGWIRHDTNIWKLAREYDWLGAIMMGGQRLRMSASIGDLADVQFYWGEEEDLYLYSATQPRDVYVAGRTNLIYMFDQHNIKIGGISCELSRYANIHIDGCKNVTVKNCTIKNGRIYGLFFDGGTKLEASSVTAEFNATGIGILSADDVNVSGGTMTNAWKESIDSSDGDGIAINSSDSIMINSCSCTKNGGSGIAIDPGANGVDNVEIKNSTLSENASMGLVVGNINQITVTQNVFANNFWGGFGLGYAGGNPGVYTNNHISCNSGRGFYCGNGNLAVDGNIIDCNQAWKLEAAVVIGSDNNAFKDGISFAVGLNVYTLEEWKQTGNDNNSRII